MLCKNGLPSLWKIKSYSCLVFHETIYNILKTSAMVLLEKIGCQPGFVAEVTDYSTWISVSTPKTESDYLYGWIKKKKKVLCTKISPKMVNPRDLAGNAEEEY